MTRYQIDKYLDPLPRTTESPVCKDGDEWERFSRRVLPQSHACKGVVRGLHKLDQEGKWKSRFKRNR